MVVCGDGAIRVLVANWDNEIISIAVLHTVKNYVSAGSPFCEFDQRSVCLQGRVKLLAFQPKGNENTRRTPRTCCDIHPDIVRGCHGAVKWTDQTVAGVLTQYEELQGQRH